MKIDRVCQLNKQFEINNNNWVVDFESSNNHHFRIKKDKSKIMISAPHSVNHIREWEVLKTDILTWGLALYLSEQFNLPCIYSTSYYVWDPNFDELEASEYKQSLIKFIKDNNIKFLLDLHWCDFDRSFAIELWTWWETHPNLQWNQKLLNLIKDSLNKSLLAYLWHTWREITINTLFPASFRNTISNFVAVKTHIPTIQLEINFDLRDPKNEEKLSKLIAALENLIVELQEYFN